MAVKIQAQFKKDGRERNGLDSDEVRTRVRDNPADLVVTVATFQATKREEDLLDGTKTDKFQLYAVEPLTGDAAATVLAMLKDAFHARTGQSPQPGLFDEVTDDAPVRVPPPDEAGPGVPAAAFVAAPDGGGDPDGDPPGTWPGDEGYEPPRSAGADADLGDGESGPETAAEPAVAGRSRRR